METGIGLVTTAVLFAAGILGGATAALAGGASFFSFPALFLSGLSPLVANATNFVALIPANIAALPAYRHELRAIGRAMIAPIVAGSLGGLTGALLLVRMGAAAFEGAVPWLTGALLLVYMGAAAFKGAVPWLIGFATLLFWLAPHLRALMVRRRGEGAGGGLAGLFGLFLLSIYGGYFGAGLGQIMLGALILMGESDFHRANALKNAVIGALSLIACVIYVAGGSVDWPAALIVMAGAALGGYLGGAMARKVPLALLRGGVIGIGVVLTVAAFVKAGG